MLQITQDLMIERFIIIDHFSDQIDMKYIYRYYFSLD